MIKRGRMVYFLLAYILLWYILAALAISFLGLSAFEAMGVGTAGGVFIKSFSDAWQFLWRTAAPGERPPS